MTVASDLHTFRNWLQDQSCREQYFSGTFWFVLSSLAEADLVRVLGFQRNLAHGIPLANSAARVVAPRRRGKALQTTFWHLPFQKRHLHLLFCLEKPWQALRPMYRLLNRAAGKAHLFPIGHRLVNSCVRLHPEFTFEQTYVVRGVSYPSRPSEGGADISLRPGNAAVFFQRLEDERRVLKLARMRAPTQDGRTCEFTISRLGYLSFHKGSVSSFLDLILESLPSNMAESVRPFERARGEFVGLRFPEPLFTDQRSYRTVMDALSRLPRTTLALLHTNPYFHATLTNYEDGGEFDVFITDTSTIHIQGRGDASPASYLRLHNNLAELFRDADVALEKPTQFRLRDLLEGRV